MSSQQAMMSWAERPGVVEQHRGLPANELVHGPLFCVPLHADLGQNALRILAHLENIF